MQMTLGLALWAVELFPWEPTHQQGLFPRIGSWPLPPPPCSILPSPRHQPVLLNSQSALGLSPPSFSLYKEGQCPENFHFPLCIQQEPGTLGIW